MKLYLRLFKYIAPYKKIAAFAILAMILTATMEPMLAALMEPLIDGSLINKDPEKILTVPLLILAVFLGKGIFSYISEVAAQWVAQKIVYKIRVQLFEKILSLPQATQQKHTSGALISKITYDVPQIASSLSSAWIVLIRDSFILIGLVGFLIYTSWELSLTLLIIAPILSWVIKKASKALRASSTDMQNSMGDMTHILEESINGHKEVKIYGGEPYERGRFSGISHSLHEQMMRIIKITAANTPIVQSLTALAMVTVLYLASIMTANDLLTPGQFMAFITAMSLLFAPLKRLTNINTDLQKGIAAAESIFELMDEPVEINTGTLKLNQCNSDIKFQDVSFTYPRKNEPVLSHFSISIPHGKTTALVGLSGSGKSTIANLIPRFFNVDSGEILIDGHNIKDFSLDSLRSKISYVSQNIVLFNDTVRANIAYGGNAEANEQQIIAAAKAAHAWEFIEQLPQGLDTQIGQNGSNLSGGQRQRIALARAFLKDAPILILDEATSALDNESERLIQQAVEQLAENRTTIVIAHRLSTIEKSDQIIVMNKGKIADIGQHNTLKETSLEYQKLLSEKTGTKE